MPNSAPRLVVLGSLNMDIVIRCAHLPAPGETVIATSSTEICGGKGANQAVAAARLGANVTMIGSVGDDDFADRLLHNLASENIDISRVVRRSNCASGFAVVAVEDSGENSIVVVPGANGMLSIEDAMSAADVIRTSDTLLLQLEVPVETVAAAIQIARDCNTRVILDPAPAPRAFPESLLQADLICPNQNEAAAILGRNVDSSDGTRDAAQALLNRGARNAIITLGAQGAVIAEGNSVDRVEAFPVEAIDTTAAGDAFAAAIAVRWAEPFSLSEAARFACAAGAIAATRAGAQPSMPTRSEVEQLIANRGKP